MSTTDQAVSARPEALEAIIALQREVAESGVGLDQVMRLVARRGQELTGGTGALVEVVDGGEMVGRAAVGSATTHLGQRLPMEGTLSGPSLRSGRTLRCDDVETDRSVDPGQCARLEARSLVVAPIRTTGFAGGCSESTVRRDEHVRRRRRPGRGAPGRRGRRVRVPVRRARRPGPPGPPRSADRCRQPNAVPGPAGGGPGPAGAAPFHGGRPVRRPGRLPQREREHGQRDRRPPAGGGSGPNPGDRSRDGHRGPHLRRRLRPGCEDAGGPRGAAWVAERVLEWLARPFRVEGHEITVGATIGISVAERPDADPEDLLREAGQAVYAAKSDGRGRYRFAERPSDLPRRRPYTEGTTT